MLDVTFYYVNGPWTTWDLFCGRIPEIIVDARELQAPEALAAGDYSSDLGTRKAAQRWVAAIWEEKDALIDTLEQQTRGQR